MYWSNLSDTSQIMASKAFQQGVSLVETMRIKDGELAYFDAHLSRLYNSLARLSMTFSLNQLELQVILTEQVKASGVTEGRGRLQTVDANGIQYFVFQVDTFWYDRNSLMTIGIHAEWSECRRDIADLRFRFKTSNYMTSWLEQARHSSAGEVIFLNSLGHVTEGSKTNLFFVKGNRVYTPEVDCNLLNGIMRQQVIKVLKREGFAISEGCYTIEDIVCADGVFVTNALMPVAQVKSIDEVHYKALPPSLSRVLKTL